MSLYVAYLILFLGDTLLYLQDPVFKETFEFDVAEKHTYLHVCVWCKIPEKLDKQQRVIKPEKDVLLGCVRKLLPICDMSTVEHTRLP